MGSKYKFQINISDFVFQIYSSVPLYIKDK